MLFQDKIFFLCWLLLITTVGCSSVTPVVKRAPDARASDFSVWTPDLRSDDVRNIYRFALKTPKNSVSGLLVLKRKDSEWAGALMHEMGAKAFDFTITDKKCKLLNVIPMMDKWYIKKTVADDLYLFIQIDNPEAAFYKRLKRFEQNENRIVNFKKKQLIVGPDGSVRLINSRRNLLYELRKMGELNSDKMIL